MNKRALIPESVAAIMGRYAVAMAGQPDIGPMAIHALRCEDISMGNRHPLRLVDRGGIAIIEAAIIFCVE